MWLRWVVTNLLSELAERKVRHAVDQARHALDRRETAQPAEGPPPPTPTCAVALVFATPLEAGALVGDLQQVVTTRCPRFVEHVGRLGQRSVAVAETGVGVTAARNATEDVIELHQPAWVISAGFAGALHEAVRRGHILMANEIVAPGQTVLQVPLHVDADVLAATPGLHVGRLVSVEGVVGHRDQKRQLAEQYGAVACDMETFAVAQVCRRRQVKFLSVRVISDALGDGLPPEIAHLVDQQTVAAKMGAATRALFHRPSSVKDVWRLRDRAQRSAERLARFLTGVVPQLDAE